MINAQLMPSMLPMAGGLPSIGDPYEGGFFAGQIDIGGTIYNLVVAPRAGGQSTGIRWKTSRSASTGTDSTSDGWANTTAMNNASHPAAQFCRGLTIGGFSDWYMPAQNELEILYFNLKPTTTNNDTSSGINPNAVPPRASNYSTTVPAQTGPADFKSGGSEAFNDTNGYWSSTQNAFSSFGAANIQRLGTQGLQELAYKDATFYAVRAIRKVPA